MDLIRNEKIKRIYSIIFDSLIKEKYSIIEQMETIMINIAFISQLHSLINFEIYSIIIKVYLSLFDFKINFKETKINLEDDISLDLILDLFNQKIKNDKIIIDSIIILKYDILKRFNNKLRYGQINNSNK